MQAQVGEGMTSQDGASDVTPATAAASTADAQARCGNCGTALRGDFWHQWKSSFVASLFLLVPVFALMLQWA